MDTDLPIPVPATIAPADHAPARLLGPGQMFGLNALWFALSALWGALLTLLLPIQVEDMLRRSGLSATQVADQKSGYLALVVAVGAVAALVIPPLVGAWSDRCTHPWGRRRPFIVAGMVVTVLGLVGMMSAPALGIYTIFYLLVQAASNVAAAAYSGIVPDLVPAEQRGAASGWLGMLTLLGNISGLVIGSVGLARAHADDLLTTAQQIGVYSLIIAIQGIFLGIAVVGARETPLTGAPPPQSLGATVKSLWISPRAHPDFAWVWITRFLVGMGFSTVQFYLLYFLQDVVGINRAQISIYGAYLFLGLLLSAAGASILGGRRSDRRGRKPLIYVSGAGMTVALLAFIGYIGGPTLPLPGPFSIAFNPIFYCGIGFGFGYGVYTAVDWALATDVLPDKDTAAAKDLGVWHIAFVLPQSLATVLAGGLLTLATGAGVSPGLRYGLVFAMSIVYLVLGTVLVRNVRGAR